MESFNISGNKVPFTEALIDICNYICEEALDFTDKAWEILENEIEWDEEKEWESKEEIRRFIYEDYYVYTVYVNGEMYISLVDKQIDDNYGLGKIHLKIGDKYGNLNSLFGFNYDLGEFDPECDREFHLPSYDITYDDIIAALKNDYKDSFESIDDFVDYVTESSKPTIKSLFYKHLINGDGNVVTSITEFLTDVINESADDNIDLSVEDHNKLLAFRDDWYDIVNKKLKSQTT